MVSVNFDSLNSKKRKGLILIIIGIFFALITLAFLIEFEIVPLIIFGIITLVLIGFGYHLRTLNKNAYRYLDLIEKGYLSIGEIAKLLNLSEREVQDEISELIADGIFVNIFLDKDRTVITQISKKNTSNTNQNSNNIKEEKVIKEEELKVYVCPGCGYKVKKTSQIQVCEFCGSNF